MFHISQSLQFLKYRINFTEILQIYGDDITQILHPLIYSGKENKYPFCPFCLVPIIRPYFKAFVK